MKNLVVILGVSVLFSQFSFSQSNPSSARPRHCSIEKDNGRPPYPDSLKGSGIQGTVLIQAVIGENGCTESVRVARKLHPELDELAKQAVTSWKFSPATKDGKPVRVIVQIAVEFKDSGQQH